MPGLETRDVRVKLRDLKLLSEGENARFMPEAEFNQLVENLKADGVLTSAPLIYEGVVLSGNHRVMAAIKAGIDEALAIEILSKGGKPLKKADKIAIQLSHNSINGRDDPNILVRLYGNLDLSHRSYSGLTDDAFKLDEIDIRGIGVGAPRYQDLNIIFLPEQEQEFIEFVARLEEAAKEHTALVAHYDDFSALFDAIVAVKDFKGVHNSAIALRLMAELAMKQIRDQQEQSDGPN